MNLTNAQRAGIVGTVFTILLSGTARAQVVAADQLRLPQTTDLGDGTADGAVYMAGERFLHAWDWDARASGSTNLFLGIEAGHFWTSGNPAGAEGRFNTGVGRAALSRIETGAQNTGIGANALTNNTGGWSNTAVGADALVLNQMGGANTAVGAGALAQNVSGIGNNAFGIATLVFNSGPGTLPSAVSLTTLRARTMPRSGRTACLPTTRGGATPRSATTV